MFWFENDLNFVNRKFTPKQHHIWQKGKKIKDRNVDGEQPNDQKPNRVVEKARWKYKRC